MKINLENDVKGLVAEGKSQEDILEFLFSKGLPITDAIVVIRSQYGIPLNDAKKIVASSRCWMGVHRDNKNLHDALQEIAEELEKATAVSNANLNAINVIAPYKHMGMWVFDDQRVGLVQEPFVGGADAMIDRVVANILNAENGFVMLFSRFPFPGYRIKLDWRRTDGSGNWYYSETLDLEGWLCPALSKYFTELPRELFIDVKPKP